MRTYLVGAAIVLAALLVVACGSGDGSSSSVSTASNTSATITKAQYITRADAICGRTEKKQLALVDKFPKQKPTQQARMELVEFAGIPPLKEQAEQLNELPEPSKDAGAAKAYVDAFSNGVKGADEDPSAMLEAPTPFAKAESLAVKFGFKVCSGA